MTRDELGAVADRLFNGSRARLADALGIRRDRFSRMMAGAVPIPDGLAEDVAKLLEPAAVGPPPDGLAPHLDALARRAAAAGWAPDEVVGAVVDWAGRKADG